MELMEVDKAMKNTNVNDNKLINNNDILTNGNGKIKKWEL